MVEEQIKAFWEAVQSDFSLLEKLKPAKDPESIAKVAQEAGFNITANQIEEAQSNIELSDEQLQGVVGGTGAPPPDPCCHSFLCGFQPIKGIRPGDGENGRWQGALNMRNSPKSSIDK